MITFRNLGGTERSLFFSEPRPHSVELWCSVSLVFCDAEQVL
jgi:hypothetical protein